MSGFRWQTGTGPQSGGAFRRIVDSGIHAGLHGDGVHIANLNPWFHFHYAITGLNVAGVQINPGQSITRQEALRCFTRENAWYLSLEDETGSLETGKRADLVVLDRDLLTTTDAELRDTRPLLTLVNGRVVYDAGAIKGVPA
jgi:predicted amidohydrolase YtcJ